MVAFLVVPYFLLSDLGITKCVQQSSDNKLSRKYDTESRSGECEATFGSIFLLFINNALPCQKSTMHPCTIYLQYPVSASNNDLDIHAL